MFDKIPLKFLGCKLDFQGKEVNVLNWTEKCRGGERGEEGPGGGGSTW